MTKGNENASEEIMAENAPNLKEEIDIQVQAARRVPNKINPDRRALEQATVKTAEAKEGFQRQQERQQGVSYKGSKPPRAVS